MDDARHQPEKPALPEFQNHSGGFLFRLFRQRIEYGLFHMQMFCPPVIVQL